MDSIIIATEDGGNSWKQINNPLAAEKITLFKIASIDKNVWAVGQRGNYIFSEDRGSNWKIPEDATNTKFWLRDMDFSDALVGWAVGSRGTIIKTEDGGRTWKMFSGIPLSSIQ